MATNENIGHGKDYNGSEFFGGNSNNTARDFGGDSDRSFETPEIDTTELSTESAFESESNPVAEEFKDSIRGMSSTEMENSNTGESLDTSFQIGDMNEDLEKSKQNADTAKQDYDRFNRIKESLEKRIDDIKPSKAAGVLGALGMGSGYREDRLTPGLADMKDTLNNVAKEFGIDYEDFSKVSAKDLKKAASEFFDKVDKQLSGKVQETQSNYDNLKSSFTDKTSKAKDKPAATPSEVMEEASKGPGENMKNAKPSTSDYLTSANKDAPKTARDTHDNFLEHALDTAAGAIDRASPTTKDLGIKDLKDWAQENGYDPSKLSTMRAYNVYQTKEIVKAVPGIMKEVGSYIEERVKDAFNPSKLGTRVTNTLARYNAASLLSAAILALKYGSNGTEALDMVLSSVDPADVPEVREALENALNDDSLVDDVSTLIDDAYSNMNSSKQGDIDSEIVNIGRKNTTDYSGFNAGLGTSSDKDVKVFITRNVKSDPVLRVLAKKLGK